MDVSQDFGKVVFEIKVGDIQLTAKDILGRFLTDEELDDVSANLKSILWNTSEAVDVAIHNVVG